MLKYTVKYKTCVYPFFKCLVGPWTSICLSTKTAPGITIKTLWGAYKSIHFCEATEFPLQ